MDSRRLAVCLAFGAALSTFSQRRRLAAVLASIGRRLMTGDSMRRLVVRLIDRLMANELPERTPRIITPANAFLYLPNNPHLHVDEDVDPFFGMKPAVFGRSASGALLGQRNPVMSEAGEPPSPRSPCEADLWCWETLGDSDSD
ncbi:NF-kappa B inihibitor [Bovine papular stomatitis virus]